MMTSLKRSSSKNDIQFKHVIGMKSVGFFAYMMAIYIRMGFDYNMAFTTVVGEPLTLSYARKHQRRQLHYTQIGRYENKGAQPSADILSKMADVLDVTTDYLMSGTQDDMAEGISDKELMTQFKRIAKLPKERKAMVKEFLDAFLLKNDLKEKLAQ